MDKNPQNLIHISIPRIILVVACLVAFHDVSNAQTVYVDVKNTSGVEDGTTAHPYNTLEEGMAACSAGKNLYIKNGNYTPSGGTWYIKPGVSISGESTENCKIVGNIKDTTYSNLPVFIEKLAFNDFIFWRGALINGQITKESIIRNCKCKNITIGHAGGYLDLSKTILGPIPYFHITDNELEGEISFSHGSGVIIGGNIIRNNKAAKISLKHGAIMSQVGLANPDIDYLIEYNNVTESIQFSQGASLFHNPDSIAKDNTKIIVRDNSAGLVGISSGGGFTYSISNNIIQTGFSDASGANWTTFSGNTIINGTINDSSGGMMDGSEDQVFENNSINFIYNGNDKPAIVDISSRSATFRNNTIKGVGKLSGVKTSSGTPTNFIDNTIKLEKASPADDISNTCGIQTTSGNGVITGNKISGANIGYYSKSGASLFANNEIEDAFYGFYGSGLEEVRNNRFSNNVYGIVISGVRGPISGNIITDNDSIGIWLIKDVDLGGGSLNGSGRNIIKGNGYYDMKISISGQVADTLYINNNVWDHDNIQDILKYDILNESSGGKLVVDFQSIIKTPAKVTLTNPANFATVASKSSAFAWGEVAGADSFRLQLASDVNFNNIILDTACVVNSLTIGGLLNNSDYFWRVRAENLAGNGEWSSVRKFGVTITGLELPVSDKVPLFTVYPVPVRERINFIYQLPAANTISINIFNETGNLVLRIEEGFKTAGKHSCFRSSNGLTDGVYICVMTMGDLVFRKKVVKLSSF